MKTAILALYPYGGQGMDSWIDHGSGMTYTAAKETGCDVDFIDLKALGNDLDLSLRLKGYDLVAFGLKSSYYAMAMRIIKIAKTVSPFLSFSFLVLPDLM